MTKFKKILILALLAHAVLSSACIYVVMPEGLEEPVATEVGSASRVWSGVVTNVGKSPAGDLRVELAIRNETGDWARMEAFDEKPAILTYGDGKTSNCASVLVGTGGHRLAPGFQIRGFTDGTPETPETRLLAVECQGAEAAPGAKLSISYNSYGGILDDYDTEANKTEGVLELNLDDVQPALTYPISVPVDGLILPAETPITGLSENVITLLETQRTDTGFQFTWQNSNPTKFPLKTHIGIPPVIGADGIIYGVYETLDMPSIPITPANDKAQWTTEVAVPKDAEGFYILLSVESKKPRTYVNYVLDISGK